MRTAEVTYQTALTRLSIIFEFIFQGLWLTRNFCVNRVNTTDIT